jgi:ketosteroid isomerase-like protein
MAATRQEQNVELIRAGFAAFEAGDVDTVLEFLDEDVEVHTAPGLINAGTHRGRDGYIAWLTEWLEAWEDFQAEPVEFEPIGERHVLVLVNQTGRGVGSGVPVEMAFHWAIELADARLTRMHLYAERERALAAVSGWQEQADTGG